MLLFNSYRLLLCPPTSVSHQTVAGDDAQWCKVFVRITYYYRLYCGYDATVSALKNFLLYFLKSDLFIELCFLKAEVIGFNLGIMESPFRAHWCMEGPKELLGTLDEMLIQHRLLATQYFVPLPYLSICTGIMYRG